MINDHKIFGGEIKLVTKIEDHAVRIVNIVEDLEFLNYHFREHVLWRLSKIDLWQLRRQKGLI